MTKIYLDNAATTPLDKRVLDVMLPFMTEKYGNPSAIHGFGREPRAAIEKARKIVAASINVSPSEIFFTSGGTESNNTAIRCAVKNYNIKHVISSPIEHHCVEYAIQHCAKEENIQIHLLDVLPNGHLNLDQLENLLKTLEGKTLVSLMYANNEIGNVLDVERVTTLCEEHEALFHTDTVQAVGHFPLDLQKTKIHFLSGSGHKFHGPKGIGFLYVNSDVTISPLLVGGSQERNMRAGTENIYGIIGLGKALELAYEELAEDVKHISELKAYMKSELEKTIDGISFNGDLTPGNLYTVLNVSLPPIPGGDMLVYNLDIAGIAASAGSACSSGSNVGSHVLSAMGVPMDRPYLRFSFSKFNTKSEIDIVVKKLAELVPSKEVA